VSVCVVGLVILVVFVCVYVFMYLQLCMTVSVALMQPASATDGLLMAIRL